MPGNQLSSTRMNRQNTYICSSMQQATDHRMRHD
jgi:hypothetical protein